MPSPGDYYVWIFGRATQKIKLGQPLTVVATETNVAGHGHEGVRIIRSGQKMAQFFKLPLPPKGQPFIFSFSTVESLVNDDTRKGRVIVVGQGGPQKTFTFTKMMGPDGGDEPRGGDSKREKTYAAVAVIRQ